MEPVNLKLIDLNNSADHNLILGQSHFIKTVEDIHELMINCVPNAKFGIAFAEASGDKLIRKSGTEEKLVLEAIRIIQKIGSGHTFAIVMRDVYPINVLPRLKEVSEVVNIFCATANPVQVVVANTNQGNGVMGVIDGGSPIGVENETDVIKRKQFLRNIGYKG